MKKDMSRVKVKFLTDDLRPNKKGDEAVMYKTTAEALGDKVVKILSNEKAKETVKTEA